MKKGRPQPEAQRKWVGLGLWLRFNNMDRHEQRAPGRKASCFQIHAELAPNHQTTLLRWKWEREGGTMTFTPCFIHLCVVSVLFNF